MQPEQQEAPGQEGGAPDDQESGGIAETLTEVDSKLAKIAELVGSDPQLPDEAKQAFASALESYRSGLQIVMEVAKGGGGGSPQGPAATSPEAGGNPNAVPASPAGVRR